MRIDWVRVYMLLFYGLLVVLVAGLALNVAAVAGLFATRERFPWHLLAVPISAPLLCTHFILREWVWARENDRIARDGVHATARVLSGRFWSYTSLSHTYAARLRLEVDPGDGRPPFPAKAVVFSQLMSPRALHPPGSTLAVLFDPDHPWRAIVDPAAHPTVTGTRGGQADATISLAHSTLIVNGKPVDTTQIPHFGETIGQLVLRGNQDPEALEEAIHGLLVQSGAKDIPAIVSHRASSSADRLKELESLHAQGLLTDEEYSRKREQLVESI